MSHSKKIQKKSCEIDRREFCKAVPCAAFGVLCSSAFAGIPLNEKISSMYLKEALFQKEESMKKKIKAVVAKVKSQKGTCGIHKVGDTVRFTELGVEGKICIHALYSMMPAVFAMLYDAHFPWLEDPDQKTHACPDAMNPVVFEITRIREE